nr:immunoglobulin light chain junction region [Macaca mulatta]
GMQALQSPFTF